MYINLIVSVDFDKWKAYAVSQVNDIPMHSPCHSDKRIYIENSDIGSLREFMESRGNSTLHLIDLVRGHSASIGRNEGVDNTLALFIEVIILVEI